MIEILGSAGCGPCLMAKKLLEDAGIEFKFYDIAERNPRLTELKKKLEVRAIPAIFREGDFVGVGLNPVKKLAEEAKWAPRTK